jgi:3-dehydroquinate dehydratase-2
MILLVNGPNLNLLGEREPELYGRETLADVERMVAETCAGYGLAVKAFQSNWEGALLDFLQEHRRQARGVIVNPGALTHTSRALADCLRALRCPVVEVHVSNIHAREAWRHESVTAPVVLGQIAGLGVRGYHYAALHLCALLSAQGAAAGGGARPAEGGGRPAAPGGAGTAAGASRAAAPAVRRPAAVPAAPRARVPAVPAVPAEPAPAEFGPDPLDTEPPAEGGAGVDRMERGEYEPL